MVAIVAHEMDVPLADRDLVLLVVRTIYNFCPDRSVHFWPRKVMGDGIDHPGCAGVE